MSSGGQAGSIALGIARLARFNAQGFAEFTATRQGFLNSLAPLLALPLVAALIAASAGEMRAALEGLLSGLVALLAPPAISHLLAALWQRQSLWLRFAVAYNWCQVPVTLLAVADVGIVSAATGGRTQGMQLAMASVAALAGYWLVLSVFLARRGLRISLLKAFVVMLSTNIGTALLVFGPRVLMASVQ